MAETARILLDSIIYDNTDLELSDIRLLSIGGSEIPFAVRQILADDGAASCAVCPTGSVPVAGARSGDPVHARYPIFLWKSESVGGATVLTFMTQREPLVSIEVATADTEFSRNAFLSGGYDGENWSDVASGRLSKSKLEGRDVAEMSIGFSERRFKFYRIVVEDAGQPPLQSPSALAVGNVYCVEFPTAGLSPWGMAMFYGGERKARERARRSIKEPPGQVKASGIVTLGLGDVMLNPKFGGEPEAAGGVSLWKWLVCSAVILAALSAVFIKCRRRHQFQNS